MLIAVRKRGTITLPAELRAELDENAVLDAVRRPDGVIELRPQHMVDATQAWFWTERWQAMEREADADVAAGRVRTYDDVSALLADLEAASDAPLER